MGGGRSRTMSAVTRVVGGGGIMSSFLRRGPDRRVRVSAGALAPRGGLRPAWALVTVLALVATMIGFGAASPARAELIPGTPSTLQTTEVWRAYTADVRIDYRYRFTLTVGTWQISSMNSNWAGMSPTMSGNLWGNPTGFSSSSSSNAYASVSLVNEQTSASVLSSPGGSATTLTPTELAAVSWQPMTTISRSFSNTAISNPGGSDWNISSGNWAQDLGVWIRLSDLSPAPSIPTTGAALNGRSIPFHFNIGNVQRAGNAVVAFTDHAGNVVNQSFPGTGGPRTDAIQSTTLECTDTQCAARDAVAEHTLSERVGTITYWQKGTYTTGSPGTPDQHVPPVVTAQNQTIWVGQAAPGIGQSDGVAVRSGATNTPFANYGGTYNGTVALTDDGGLDVNTPGAYTQRLTATDNTDNTSTNRNRTVTVRALPDAPSTFTKDALGTDGDLKLINKTSDTATYRLSFAVPADVAGYQGLTLSDTLPAELQYVSSSGWPGGTPTVSGGPGGEALSWTLTQAQIAAAAGSTVSVDVTVKLSAAATSQDNGAVTNTAALHVDYDPSMPDPPADPDPATNTELEIGLPDAPSGFTKVKSDGDGILNSLEETAEYTISMNVPADVSEYASIVATDAVPSTLQIVGSPTTASGTASASGNTVTWTLDTPAQLADAAGKTITLTIPVRAAANATAADNGVITNTANTTVTFSDASTEDLPPATNTEVELRLTPAPTGLTKALSSGEAGKPAWDAGVLNHADDAVEFQVSAKLPADVRNYASFTLIDTLPAGLAVEGTPSVDADGADVTGLGTFTAASTRWTVDLTDASNAAALAGKTITMTLAVVGDGIDDTDNGTLTNTGSWAVTPIPEAQDPADPDPDPENVVVSYPEPIDPDSVFKDAQGSGADLKLINKSPTSPDTATYRLGFTLPQDVSDYAGVTLTDALPAELEYVSDTGLAGVNATVAGQTLTWALDQATVQANAGQALTVDVVVKVASGAISADNGALTNTATVSVQWDPNLPGDQQPEDPEPKPNTEVELGLPDPPGAFTKIVSEGDGVLGSLDETATYRISMNIPQDVSEYQEVRITDQVPALLQIVGDPATDSGTASASGNTVTWVLDAADSAAAAGTTIELTVRVKAAAGVTNADNGVITNTADTRVTYSDSTTEDLDPAVNDDVELALTVDPSGLTKTLTSDESGKPAWDAGILNHSGDTVEFAVSVDLPSEIRNYTAFSLIDELPAGLVVEGTPTVTAGGTDITSLGSLSADRTRWTIDLTLPGQAGNQAAVAGRTLTMTLAVRGDGLDYGDNGTLTNRGTWKADTQDGTDDPVEPPQPPEEVVEVSYPEPPSNVEKLLVSDTSPAGVAADNDRLEDSAQTATYTLQVEVPADVSQYASLTLTDVLPDELDYVSDSGIAGTPVTAAAVNGRELTWVLDPAALAAVAGTTVSIDVTVEGSGEASADDNGKPLVNAFRATAAYLDAVPEDSRPADPDEVTNDELQTAYPENPTGLAKTLTGGDGKLSDDAEQATYTVAMTMPEDTRPYAGLTITDTMPAELELEGTPVVQVDGQDVTGFGSFSADHRSWTTTDRGTLDGMAGKAVTMEVTVSAIAGLTLADNGEVVNTASLAIDWDPTIPTDSLPRGLVPVDNDEVEVDYPEPENPTELAKTVTGGDGVLNTDTERTAYTISMRMPADTRWYASLTISDRLPEELELEGTPVVRVDGRDVTKQGTFSADRLSWTTTDRALLDRMAGAKVTMEVVASLVDGAQASGELTNVATVKVGWDPSVPADLVPGDPDEATNTSVAVDLDQPDRPEGTRKQDLASTGAVGMTGAALGGVTLVLGGVLLTAWRRRRDGAPLTATAE